jgi:hypothetical protein
MDDVHFVSVKTDDLTEQLWAVAIDREQAIDAIPEGWSASLLNESWRPQQKTALHMAPGRSQKVSEDACRSQWRQIDSAVSHTQTSANSLLRRIFLVIGGHDQL